MSTKRSIEMGDPATGPPIVKVWYRGHSVGLYRVAQVGERDLVLRHGVISFPVGTALDVVDFQRVIPHSASRRLSTTVIGNTRSGIRLAW